MKPMIFLLRKHRYSLILTAMIILFSLYFSYLSLMRYWTFNSSYYDLGIMDQTVYNTFRGRVLELTNPTGVNTFRRMAIHNDILLALFAPFYFIYSGPETVLVAQSILVALGALPVYFLVRYVVRSRILSLVFSFSYLMYVPLQRATLFDFHAVTVATTILLFMVYFAVRARYRISFIFFILALFAKENVALTTTLFGVFFILKGIKKSYKPTIYFGLLIAGLSIFWFIESVWIVIPFFRQSLHFAITRYSEFGSTPQGVIGGTITHFNQVIQRIFHSDTARYIYVLFAPLAFFSLLAPLWSAIAIPEFAINLLSNNWNMQNIFFHYTAVITPFVFIAGIYGSRRLMRIAPFITPLMVSILILITTGAMSYFKGPFPFSRERVIYIPSEYQLHHIQLWRKTLKNENLIISATPKIAPYFTNRKTFYLFDKRYVLADYVVIRTDAIELKHYPYNTEYLKDTIDDTYKELQENPLFENIFNQNGIEVYKRIKR